MLSQLGHLQWAISAHTDTPTNSTNAPCPRLKSLGWRRGLVVSASIAWLGWRGVPPWPVSHPVTRDLPAGSAVGLRQCAEFRLCRFTRKQHETILHPPATSYFQEARGLATYFPRFNSIPRCILVHGQFASSPNVGGLIFWLFDKTQDHPTKPNHCSRQADSDLVGQRVRLPERASVKLIR